jgi:hypothetical protein
VSCESFGLGPVYENVLIFLTSMNCTSHLFDTSMNHFRPLDARK